MDKLEEAIGHLGAALVQAVPSDDQIIVGHIKGAHQLLVELNREARLVRRLATNQRKENAA